MESGVASPAGIVLGRGEHIPAISTEERRQKSQRFEHDEAGGSVLDAHNFQKRVLSCAARTVSGGVAQQKQRQRRASDSGNEFGVSAEAPDSAVKSTPEGSPKGRGDSDDEPKTTDDQEQAMAVLVPLLLKKLKGVVGELVAEKFNALFGGVQDDVENLRQKIDKIPHSYKVEQSNLKGQFAALAEKVDAAKKQCELDVLNSSKDLSHRNGTLQSAVDKLRNEMVGVQQRQKAFDEWEDERTAMKNQLGEVMAKIKTDMSKPAEPQMSYAAVVQKMQKDVETLKQTKEKECYSRSFKITGYKIPQATSAQLRLKAVFAEMQLENVDIEEMHVLRGKDGQMNGGPILFRVLSATEAKLIRDKRYMLKGKGFSVMDQLTPDELSRYKTLKPMFDKAVAANKQLGEGVQPTRVKFVRDRLYIDGKEVMPTQSQGGGSGSRASPNTQ